MKISLGAKTIVLPTPVLIIGTYDSRDVPNAMAVAWGGICCSDPPAVAISVRKARHTYGNLMAKKAFTVNIPSERYLSEADYFGVASGKTENKFERSGLTPVRAEFVDAPFVAEFPIVLECAVIKVTEIGVHTQFIGEIKDVKADQAVIGAQNTLDISRVKPFWFNPADLGYYAVGGYLAKAYSAGKKA